MKSPAKSPTASTKATNPVSSARVLVVGAGGIGCELLKNLSLSGFHHIDVVDLDTIDLSNLNRQFLFRQKHIGQSKAIVAASAVQKFNPHVQINAYRANIITDPQFTLTWFRQFDIVLNALDNIEARRHVNRMCLATDTPLVESGTAGLEGQATVHVRGQSECFDCTPKPAPVTFPICTIRSTPSKPIHCVVWAKDFLFQKLFGLQTDDGEIVKVLEGEDVDEKQLAALRKETEAVKQLRSKVGSAGYAKSVFGKVFDVDIRETLKDKAFWKGKRAPTALSFTDLFKEAKTAPVGLKMGIQREHQVWSLLDCFRVFETSCNRLGERMSGSELSDLQFDKDDDDMLDFVVASANLRAHIFGIDMLSLFQIKEMAGNIIPAIATTNAVIAGLVTLLAMRILNGDFKSCKTTFLSYGNSKRYLHNEALQAPNPFCGACALVYLPVHVNVETVTLEILLEQAVRNEKTGLGFDGDVSILRGDESLIYDFDFEDFLPKVLKDIKINYGDQVTVVDERDEDECRQTVVFLIDKPVKGQRSDAVVIDGSLSVPKKPLAEKPEPEPEPETSPKAEEKGGKRVIEELDDDVEILSETKRVKMN